MKKSTTLSLILLLTMLIGCKTEIAEKLVSQSENKEVTLTLSAKKEVMGDPWTCLLHVNGYKVWNDSLVFQAQAEKIDNSNVEFDWTDNQNCLITVTQSEGLPRKFQLEAEPNSVHIFEIEN